MALHRALWACCGRAPSDDNEEEDNSSGGAHPGGGAAGAGDAWLGGATGLGRLELLRASVAGALCGGALVAPSVRLVRAADSATVATSGLSLPKLLDVVGSDGREYRQVVKRDPDMRQDELLQTYLGACNALLASASAARRRGLALRTYRVVPVSPRSGVIEFVRGVQPLLQPVLGLHRRYRPHDLDHTQAQRRMEEAAASSLAACRRALGHIMSCGIRPAFHWFFLERFPHPEAATQRRRAFATSLAAASAAGHIVGLGDRHLSNVMLDTATAEVVHIDFGVCFESGHLLATPERVPFRLTRDLVAGLGATGVDGTFRQGLAAALTVARSAPQSPLAVIGVLLDDPLCKWVMSEQQRTAWQRRVEAAQAAEEAMAAAAASERSTTETARGPGSRSVSVAQWAGAEGEEDAGASGSQSTRQGDASDAMGGEARGPSMDKVSDLAPETRAAGGALKRAEELGAMATTGMGGSRPAQAKSTLQRCKDKLQGIENGAATHMDASRQGDFLIGQATDVDRLAAIYRGWAAWF